MWWGPTSSPASPPRQWGGWGYRWRPDQGTGVVVRRGEGFVVRLGDGRSFTVTVDDAEAAVRVIRDRPGARRGPPGLRLTPTLRGPPRGPECPPACDVPAGRGPRCRRASRPPKASSQYASSSTPKEKAGTNSANVRPCRLKGPYSALSGIRVLC
ncbi:hypothetical protein GCM10020221_12770 [Streptomyces thioluteus]|uniref:Uncharacterized protein n=1 Tax=Streptomyces thioluteus TaxID=66431 RepID=A0ABP6J271_STRTU